MVLFRAIPNSQVDTLDLPENSAAPRQISRNTSLTTSSAIEVLPVRRMTKRWMRTLWRMKSDTMARLSPLPIDTMSTSSAGFGGDASHGLPAIDDSLIAACMSGLPPHDTPGYFSG